MDFIKKHYEKIILSVVLIVVLGALASLPFVIQSDKDAMKEVADKVTKPNIKPLDPLDLTAQNALLERLAQPYELDLSTTNKLFNPVQWKKNAAGELIKITTGHEIDAEAAIVTKITPLALILSLDGVETNSGIRYVIGVEREAAATKSAQRKQQRYASIDEKKDVFTITSVKGAPENPDQVVLKLTDSGETAILGKGQTYRHVEAYSADLRFDPEKKVFLGRRVGASLTFGGDTYNIVAISEDEAVLLAQSNQKKTILHLAP